jgi:Tfp pilus assembly pilus retraction ATPase PilT
MQTMDSHLAQLVRSGAITREIAERRASVPEEIKRLLGAAGGPQAAPMPRVAAV